MLGNTVNDPYGVEGGGKIRGLELIDMETTLKKKRSAPASEHRLKVPEATQR